MGETSLARCYLGHIDDNYPTNMGKKIITHIVVALLGAMLGAMALVNWYHAERTVTYRLSGPQGCRVGINYRPGAPPGVVGVIGLHAEALLPWEVSVRMSGGSIASVSTVSAEGCRPQCSILVDGREMMGGMLSSCEMVLNRF